MIGNTEKCLNPWVGFAIILAVCTVISVAIFYEFRANPRHKKAHRKVNSVNVSTHAAAPDPGVGGSAGSEKLVF